MSAQLQSIEDWRIYREAVTEAGKRGLCFNCRHAAGFAAVEKAHGTPVLPQFCAKCARKAAA